MAAASILTESTVALATGTTVPAGQTTATTAATGSSTGASATASAKSAGANLRVESSAGLGILALLAVDWVGWF